MTMLMKKSSHTSTWQELSQNLMLMTTLSTCAQHNTLLCLTLLHLSLYMATSLNQKVGWRQKTLTLHRIHYHLQLLHWLNSTRTLHQQTISSVEIEVTNIAYISNWPDIQLSPECLLLCLSKIHIYISTSHDRFWHSSNYFLNAMELQQTHKKNPSWRKHPIDITTKYIRICNWKKRKYIEHSDDNEHQTASEKDVKKIINI